MYSQRGHSKGKWSVTVTKKKKKIVLEAVAQFWGIGTNNAKIPGHNCTLCHFHAFLRKPK